MAKPQDGSQRSLDLKYLFPEDTLVREDAKAKYSSISRVHAIIEKTGKGSEVRIKRDERASNRTYLDGAAVDVNGRFCTGNYEATLTGRDTIRLGTLRLVYRNSEED